MKLKNGLTEKALLKRIGLFVRMAGIGERGLGFYLLDLDRRGLFRKLGFSSTAQLALMRYQVPARKTRELLRVARALDDLPLIDDAFAAGSISWSAVREISRVAVRDTEKEWLDLASKSSLRAIESAVRRAQRGERPPQDPYGLSRAKLKVIAELAIDDHALWQAAFDRVAAGSGSDLDASTALLVLAKSYLEKPLTRKESQARQAFQVVYHRCTECDRAWIQTEDGVEGVPAAKVAARELHARVVRVLKDSQDVRVLKNSQDVRVPRRANNAVGDSVIDDCLDPLNNSKHDSRGPSNPVDKKRKLLSDRSKQSAIIPRAVAKSVPPDQRDKPNTPAIRQRVLSRDGVRCRAPGCSNRAQLASHHVVWRSHGGATTVDNEVGVCTSCHSLIHEGLLHVKVSAPAGLEWLGADGDAISRFDGGASRVRLAYGRDWLAGDSRGSLGEDSTIHSLAEVPDEVDSDWWKRYGHNFEIRGTRLVLKRGR